MLRCTGEINKKRDFALGANIPGGIVLGRLISEKIAPFSFKDICCNNFLLSGDKGTVALSASALSQQALAKGRFIFLIFRLSMRSS